MSIKKLDDGRYRVDVRPAGRTGQRIRRVFDRKAEAHRFERCVISKYQAKEWGDYPTDKRRMSEFVAEWWKLAGRYKTFAGRRLSALSGICYDMGDPMLYQVNARTIIDYRAYRLEQGIKASTINHDLFLLSGAFKEMAEAGEFNGENPVSHVKPLKESKPEMSYLTQEEVSRLLEIATGDYYRIAVLCLATGARWGEAHNLKAENIIGDRVVFTLTKNGRRRTVPLSENVLKVVKKGESGRLFRVSYSRFRLLMKEAKPNLPRGQAAHALRHTFATHFMMRGGNIIALQRILGHADISQTMVYAHFSPDYLNEAARFSPVAGLSLALP
ncbi:TPA: tyrosine-type recombinase/integrase [Salmonella enterica subsp. diarizonae]